LLAGCLLSPMSGQGAIPPAVHQNLMESPANMPDTNHNSALNFTPIYGFPGRYLFSGNYFTHLSITELRIDHVTEDSRCTRRNRSFMISAGYAMPIGNQLGAGRFEVPFLSADSLTVSRLAPASVGDYVVHLSNDHLYSGAAEMFLTARF
jgi:hypothetical protein